jgi:hypothetical protein
MTAMGTNISAKASPARTLNPVSSMAGRDESTERPQWGHTECPGRDLENSSSESAIVILLVLALLRERLSVLKRCK